MGRKTGEQVDRWAAAGGQVNRGTGGQRAGGWRGR